MFSLSDITGEMAKTFAPNFKSIITDYMSKDAKVDNATWLGEQLAKNLPHLASDVIVKIGEGLLGGVNNYNERLTSIKAANAQGQASAEWLRDYLEDNLPKDNMQSNGEYLEQVDNNISMGNDVARKAFVDENGMINITEEAMAINNESSGQEWNRFTVQPIIADISQQAELMGANALGMPLGNELIQQATSMPTGVIPEDYLTGESEGNLDQGIKLAAAAAIKIFIEKKQLPFLSKILPVQGIADIACWGVEGAKCVSKLALGKISAAQALEHMKNSSIAAISGFIVNGVAPKLIGMIPVVGMPLGIATSALLAGMSTEEIQQKIANGIELVAGVASEVVVGVTNTVKAGLNKVKNSVMQFLGTEA